MLGFDFGRLCILLGGARFAQESAQTVLEALIIWLDLTLPQHQRFPPHGLQLSQVFSVALYIAANLLDPVLPVGFRNARAAFALVTMPEAAMHEYNFLATGKHQIRFAWQFLAVQSISISQAMNQAANFQFWRRVLAFDLPHDSAAGFRGFTQRRRSIFML